MKFLRAQGATEYLVLLAVVLIVALVSVALLGFFPGMASDAQMTQSQAYWSGAGPIAVTESAAKAFTTENLQSAIYIRVRNNGAYTISITKLLSESTTTDLYWKPVGGSVSIAGAYIVPPGGEAYFGTASFAGLPVTLDIEGELVGGSGCGGGGGSVRLCLKQRCDAQGKGFAVVKNFGFEYVETVEGQQITKRQVGAKDLVAKCVGTL